MKLPATTSALQIMLFTSQKRSNNLQSSWDFLVSTRVALYIKLTEMSTVDKGMLWTIPALGILTGRHSGESSDGINPQSTKGV